MVQFDGIGIPRPHHLQAYTIADDGHSLLAKVVFRPDDDVAVADRPTHVNIGSQLFAIWNGAHLLARQAELSALRATNVQSRLPREVKPNQEIEMAIRVLRLRRHSKLAVGKLEAVFTDGAGRLLAKHTVTFVALGASRA